MRTISVVIPMAVAMVALAACCGGVGDEGAEPDLPCGAGGQPSVPAPVCIEAPANVASIPDSPCWWDGNCTPWFGCLRGVCLAYGGNPMEPGYCAIELADTGTICGADPDTGAAWTCDANQRCCSGSPVADAGPPAADAAIPVCGGSAVGAPCGVDSDCKPASACERPRCDEVTLLCIVTDGLPDGDACEEGGACASRRCCR